MACSVERDAYGTTFTVPAGGKLPAVEVWWSRDGNPADETIVIRQEYPNRPTADVLELTFGQLYDLIDALNKAVETA